MLLFLGLWGITVVLSGAQEPPPGASQVKWDVIYCQVAKVELTMDLYCPQAGYAPYPLVVYVHGGGWTGGNKRGGAGLLDLPTLLAHGYVVASIDYRLAPRWKFPAQAEDVFCAIRYLRAHAEELQIDPQRIGAYGSSAGGHLVSLLGTADETAFLGPCPWEASARVQAVVNMFGPTDFALFDLTSPKNLDKGLRVFGTVDLNDPIFLRASPVTWVCPDDPPFLILHGEYDQTVPLAHAQALYARLVSVGVPVELIVVKNAGHGFSPTGGSPEPSREEISALIATFFDRWLKNE